MARPRRATVALALAFATGCAAPPPKVGGATTLPLGDGGRWTLTPTGVATEGGSVRWPAPDGAGAPVDAVVEPRAGHAAIAYENALAFVDLSAFEPEPTFVAPPPFAVRRLAIQGTQAIATGGDQLALYALEGNGWNRIWTAAKPSPLTSLQFAVPISAEAYAAVGEGPNGRPRVVRMSREQGSWVVANDEALRNMSRVDAALSIGTDLFVFGVREEAAYRPVSSFAGGRIDPKDVQLKARKFDLERLVPYDLDSIDIGGVVEVAVTDVAVSPDRVVLVLNGTKVLAYRNTDGADWLQPIRQTRYSSPVTVTWVGGRRFELSGADRTWTEEFE